MTKLESLQDIKDTVIKLQKTLIGPDKESIMKAEKAFQELVDRFYQENEEMMAPQQYEASKKDFEYFIQLVKLAITYEQEEIYQDKSIDTLH